MAAWGRTPKLTIVISVLSIIKKKRLMNTSKISSCYIFSVYLCTCSAIYSCISHSACFNVLEIVPPNMFTLCEALFRCQGEGWCQGIVRQVSQGAKQSPRHFNPKRLDCFIYKASLGSGLRGASEAKVHQVSSIGRSRTDLRRHTRQHRDNGDRWRRISKWRVAESSPIFCKVT